MMGMNALLRNAALGSAFLGALLVSAQSAPARALTEGEDADVIFRSPDLRIYRALDRRGAVALVLTNLDEGGNLLRGSSDTPVCAPAPSRTPDAGGSAPSASAATEPDRTSEGKADASNEPAGHGGVTVTVNGGTDAGPAGGTQVEVSDGGQGGTTVVININNNPPAPPPAPVPVYYSSAVVVGGIAGAFRYPDRQPFLGYSLDGRSPGFFGGLGLNAGNRFGLKTGNSCGNGYDCLFAPTGRKP
jgi:hypothetical protein